MNESSDVLIERQGWVATVTMQRGPHNFLDVRLLQTLAETLFVLDEDPDCRSVVLTGAGRSFCAGANFAPVAQSGGTLDSAAIYLQAMRLFETTKPIVAAVNGAAIGAGAGLALVADFRIGGPDTRFAFNFARLGFHPGFGTTYTLPRLIGQQSAARLLLTGERIAGKDVLSFGLVDELVSDDAIVARAQALAASISESAPLAVASTRIALRGELAKAVRNANAKELEIQRSQFRTADYREGISAAQERRTPRFIGA